MSLSAAEIGIVTAEIDEAWTGAQAQKLHMRGPTMAIFGLRRPGRSAFLVISSDADSSFLCTRSDRGQADEKASSFCMLLRRLLKGRRILSITQLGGDRVVEVKGVGGSLVAEMTGRRGCLVALDPAGKVLAVSASSPLRAELKKGAPYVAPAQGGRATPESRFEPGQANDAIRALYGDVAERETRERVDARSEVARALGKRLKKTSRAITKVEADLERGRRGEEHSRHGELLKLVLWKVKRGMSSISVEDILFGSGQEVEIALDPTLDGAGNLERLFRKARKARRTIEAAAERLEALSAEKEALEERLRLASEATDEAEIHRLAAELGIGGGESGPRRKKGDEPRKPFHRFADQKGRPLLVGRSAADNDRMLSKHAKPGDLWLHAKSETGSHVVIPLARDEEVDGDRLVDAATLAAHYSAAKSRSQVEVSYVPRRYVRKPKGSPPGLVTLLREKVILVTMEPARLKRLLATKERT